MNTDNHMPHSVRIAYFSMEIALESSIPTYAGGLGVLAGDTLRAAADAALPMIGVTLLSRHGNFRQRLDDEGNQTEEPIHWPIIDYMLPVDVKATVEIEDRIVVVRAWRYELVGQGGYTLPVYLLDTDVSENTEYDRTLTDELYGGDRYYRLCQEAILGIGGIRILRALGYESIDRYHMNEGHSSLLVFELLREARSSDGANTSLAKAIEKVRRQCIFTTHTPVDSGHDHFPVEMAGRVLKECIQMEDCKNEFCCNNELNMTYIGLSGSYYINGVAKQHRITSSSLFEGYTIDSITNGVHHYHWATESTRALLDHHIKDWQADAHSLRYAISIPLQEIWDTHMHNKKRLIERINKQYNTGMDWNFMTLGFARRATSYKRTTLILSDLERLKSIADHCGPLQIVFSGKAHPKDLQGKKLIKDIYKIKAALQNDLHIIYLEDYDMDTARLMCAGVDLWINTPLPPLEASGTSGMKAAINGVPSLSVLDGWWIEGCIEGVTGWSVNHQEHSQQQFGSDNTPTDDQIDADSLYYKLEHMIAPMFYFHRDEYVKVMRNAIAINGSFFNTERMISQYVTRAYFR